MKLKSVVAVGWKRSDDLGPFETVSPKKPIFKTVSFAVEPKGWALKGFLGYADGRLPDSDADLLRLSGRSREPGEYIFFSYDHMLVFTEHFVELEAEGYFRLAEGSSSLVLKREVTVVPDFNGGDPSWQGASGSR